MRIFVGWVRKHILQEIKLNYYFLCLPLTAKRIRRAFALKQLECAISTITYEQNSLQLNNINDILVCVSKQKKPDRKYKWD